MAYTGFYVVVGRPLACALSLLSPEEQEAIEDLRNSNPDLIHDVSWDDGDFVVFGERIGNRSLYPGFIDVNKVDMTPTPEQEARVRAFCEGLPPVIAKNRDLRAFGRHFVSFDA